jgi:hypothetical protein
MALYFYTHSVSFVGINFFLKKQAGTCFRKNLKWKRVFAVESKK